MLNTDFIRKLMKEAHISVRIVSESTGLSAGKLNRILNNSVEVTLGDAEKLAEFFCISLDGLCKGQDIKEYQQYFSEIYRYRYEEKAKNGEVNATQMADCDVWPYNLLNDVYNIPINFIICRGFEYKLEKALSKLKDRDKQILVMRYKDRCLLDEIGQVMNISKERVRQIIRLACRKLSHPNIAKSLLDGCASVGEYTERYNDLVKREQIVAKTEVANADVVNLIKYGKQLADTISAIDSGVQSDTVISLVKGWQSTAPNYPDLDAEIYGLDLPHLVLSKLVLDLGIADVSSLIVQLATDKGRWELQRINGIGKKKYADTIKELNRYLGFEYITA